VAKEDIKNIKSKIRFISKIYSEANVIKYLQNKFKDQTLKIEIEPQKSFPEKIIKSLIFAQNNSF
jgi:hypothetical protein